MRDAGAAGVLEAAGRAGDREARAAEGAGVAAGDVAIARAEVVVAAPGRRGHEATPHVPQAGEADARVAEPLAGLACGALEVYRVGMNHPNPLLVVLLVLLFVGAVFGFWRARGPAAWAWGYKPFGGFTVLFVVLLLILLLGGSSGFGMTMTAHGCGAHW